MEVADEETELNQSKVSKECQAKFPVNSSDPSNIFFCSTVNYSNGLCDAEVQVEIPESDKMPEKLTFEKKREKTASGSSGFTGFKSIHSERQLIDLAGVTLDTFNIFYTSIRINCQDDISKENRLLIFFVKLKTGLDNQVLSLLFQLDEATISKIFLEILQYLSNFLRNVIEWPSKNEIQANMPECFNPDYSNVRMIVDSLEFPIEVPSDCIDDRVLAYSNDKRNFTAKILIGYAPNGKIIFKSDVAGGLISEPQMIIDSKLFDLLKKNDAVLIDKKFPEIKEISDKRGKEVLETPSFLFYDSHWSDEAIEKSYSDSSLQTHIYKIKERINFFKILVKVPSDAFSHLDELMHIICCLVNLLPEKIKAEDEDTDSDSD